MRFLYLDAWDPQSGDVSSRVRATGRRLSYATPSRVFGGSAEYVALSLKSVGMEVCSSWYIYHDGPFWLSPGSLMLHRKGKGLRAFSIAPFVPNISVTGCRANASRSKSFQLHALPSGGCPRIAFGLRDSKTSTLSLRCDQGLLAPPCLCRILITGCGGIADAIKCWALSRPLGGR